MPVPKVVGSSVVSGTINQNGTFFLRVTIVGSETSISKIIKMIEVAQYNKAPIQAFADRVSSIFVPIVLGLGVLTFITWLIIGHFGLFADEMPESSSFLNALLFSISVIVIACPCALGLATPTAVMVGTGIGARHGIMIKGGSPLERCHAIRTIMFDKTGTLTPTKPQLT